MTEAGTPPPDPENDVEIDAGEAPPPAEAAEATEEKHVLMGGGEDAASAYVAPRVLPLRPLGTVVEDAKVKLSPKIDPRAVDPAAQEPEQRQRLQPGRRHAPTIPRLEAQALAAALAPLAAKKEAAEKEVAQEKETTPAPPAEVVAEAVERDALSSNITDMPTELGARKKRSRLMLVLATGTIAFFGILVVLLGLKPREPLVGAKGPSDSEPTAQPTAAPAPPPPVNASPAGETTSSVATPPSAEPASEPPPAEASAASEPEPEPSAKKKKPKKPFKPKPKSTGGKYAPSSI